GNDVPDLHHLPGARGQALAVWTEGHAPDGMGATFECEDSLACAHVPHQHGGIPSGHGQALPVGAEGQTVRYLRTPPTPLIAERERFFAAGQVPDRHLLRAGRGKTCAVRAEGNTVEFLVRGSPKGDRLLGRLRVHNLYLAGKLTRCAALSSDISPPA